MMMHRQQTNGSSGGDGVHKRTGFCRLRQGNKNPKIQAEYRLSLAHPILLFGDTTDTTTRVIYVMVHYYHQARTPCLRKYY